MAKKSPGPFKDYYKILSVTEAASDEQIKAAYRILAMKYHPDRNPDENTHQKFIDLNEAYTILSDPHKRHAYNRRYSIHYKKPSPQTGSGLAKRREITRQKRASRYSRSMYSQRMRYRTSSGSGNKEPRPQKKRAYSQASEAYKKRVDKELAEEESRIKAFEVYASVFRVVAMILIFFCSGMLLDGFLSEPTGNDRVVSKRAEPWSFATPNMTRIQTEYNHFVVNANSASYFRKGRIVRPVKTLFGRVILSVYVEAYGETYQFKTYGHPYDGMGVFCMILILLAALFTVIFRRNPEYNAYAGTVTAILAIILFGIIFT